MRNVKFRGKRVMDGTWVYGNLFYWIRYGKKIPIIGDGVRNGSVQGCEVDSETICQFTGLYDTNNEELYENDLVKTWGTYRIRGTYRIGWSEKHCLYGLYGENGKLASGPISDSDKDRMLKCGNIYDNSFKQ